MVRYDLSWTEWADDEWRSKMQDSNRPSCYSTKLIETDDPEAILGMNIGVSLKDQRSDFFSQDVSLLEET